MYYSYGTVSLFYGCREFRFCVWETKFAFCFQHHQSLLGTRWNHRLVKLVHIRVFPCILLVPGVGNKHRFRYLGLLTGRHPFARILFVDFFLHFYRQFAIKVWQSTFA